MDHPPPAHPLRRGVLGLSAGLALAAAGCAAPDAGPVPLTSVPVEASFLDPAGMPHLSPSVDGVLLSWWAPVEGGHALRTARWNPESGFGEVGEVVRGDGFFVNWADYPSVVEVAPGKWAAHWLQRVGPETFAYGVRVAVSQDGGATWSEPWTPHDASPTEHGFVSIWPEGDGAWSLVWLDGRKYADGPHGAATQEMTIRARTVAADGTPGPEAVLDHRGCDCCQTDAVMTSRGPAVVYRDRTEDEVRDIYFARRDAGGWTPGHPVHDDGWVIGGCPVNGPAMDGVGDDVVVAWFTGAQDDPRVHVAFSTDAGDTFGAPFRVDDGRPVGRTDVVRLADGAALVAWLEETDAGAEIRLRRVSPEGEAGASRSLAATSAARASGFPQFVAVPGGGFLAAWTEVREGEESRVRMSLVEAW